MKRQCVACACVLAVVSVQQKSTGDACQYVLTSIVVSPRPRVMPPKCLRPARQWQSSAQPSKRTRLALAHRHQGLLHNQMLSCHFTCTMLLGVGALRVHMCCSRGTTCWSLLTVTLAFAYQRVKPIVRECGRGGGVQVEVRCMVAHGAGRSWRPGLDPVEFPSPSKSAALRRWTASTWCGARATTWSPSSS